MGRKTPAAIPYWFYLDEKKSTPFTAFMWLVGCERVGDAFTNHTCIVFSLFKAHVVIMGARRPDHALMREQLHFLLKPIRHSQLLQCVLLYFAPHQATRPAKGLWWHTYHASPFHTNKYMHFLWHSQLLQWVTLHCISHRTKPLLSGELILDTFDLWW